MVKLDNEALTIASADFYNALSYAHNNEVDRLAASGHTPAECALAGYMALRAMISRLDGPVNSVLAPESWEAVETIIRIMCEQAGHLQPSPTVKA